MASIDRRPYLSATGLTQDLLNLCADNLEFGLEMVADIELPTPPGGYIRASDRNKYVGSTFYEALCQFPVIKRTIGEWLSPTLEFSTMDLPLSNVDARFNAYLQGGASYKGWIGKTVDVRLGLADRSATFVSIYKGRVTDIAGIGRDRMKMTIRTRDDFDRLNVNFPKSALLQSTYPDLEDDLNGKILPVVYGDWTLSPLPVYTDKVSLITYETAQVPAYVLNGKNATVLAGGANVQCLVSENDNAYFDITEVWVKRSDVWGNVPAGNIASLTGNRSFQIVQGFTFSGGSYVYAAGDQIFVRVQGKDLGAYSDNIVWQARDILMTQAGALFGDFDNASWVQYRDKTTPAESATGSIKSRIWLQEPTAAMTYVGSMFEQVRLEPFINRSQKIAIKALHLDEFVASPAFTVKQWDVQDQSFSPRLDDRNVWNRVRGEYAFDPSVEGQARQTATFRNQDAVDQAGKLISKKVVFPNLYVEADVVNQLKEMLRLASGYPEFIDLTLTPRAMLLDVGDFIAIDLQMGSVSFSGVPCMVREIGYDPKGLRIPVRLWSFQMTPFPGWSPGYSGIVGGSTATITQET